MTDLAFLFQRKRRFIRAAFFETLIVSVILRVHEIKVKVLHTARLKLAFKERTDILLALEVAVGQLICQNKMASVISFRDTFAHRDLTLGADIAVGGIKVVEASVDERVCHPAYLLVIDLVAVHRQTHTPKSKVAVDLRKKTILFHAFTPLF